MRLSLDLGLGSRSLYDNTALGNGILGWMARTGVWQDEANGQPTLWNDGEVWNDGVSRNFTAVALDTNADPGDICGTIAPLPDGGAVTYTLADTMGGRFAIDGANVVVGSTALLATTYNLVANAVNVSGWTWSVPCTVTVALGEVAYDELNSTVGRNALLTGLDLGNPAWFTDPENVLRYPPETLVGPVTIGVTTDVFGALVKPKVTNASGTRLVSLDYDLDWLAIGSQSWASMTPLTSASTFTGGRRARFIGIDTGGRKISLQRMNRLYAEGLRGDFSATPEDDFIFTGGNSTDQYDPNGSRLTFQMIHGKGLHGTNRGHNAPQALAAPITSDSSKNIRVQLTEPASNPLVVGADVIIAGTVYGGVSLEQVAFNGSWEITSVVSTTEFYARPNPGTVLKYSPYRIASGATDNTTGAVWVMTVGIGNSVHADGIQHTVETDKKSKEIRAHLVTIYNNYQGYINSGDPTVRLSFYEYIYLSAINLLLNPNDDGSEFARIGDQAIGSGIRLKENIACRAKVRPVFDLWEQLSPDTGDGAVAGSSGARQAVTFDRDEFRGGWIELLDTDTDYVSWDDVGFGYVANKTYYGALTPLQSHLQNITYSGGSTIASGTAAGATLGSLDCIHTIGDSPEIIDFEIDSETSEGYVFIHGSRLVRGLASLPSVGASFNVKINAIVRGRALGIQTTLTFTVSA